MVGTAWEVVSPVVAASNSLRITTFLAWKSLRVLLLLVGWIWYGKVPPVFLPSLVFLVVLLVTKVLAFLVLEISVEL